MKLKEILAKVAKGEALADDEKSYLGSYDPQAELDSAAAAARKRADAEAKAAKDALAALQGEFDDYKAANDPAKGQGEIARLTKRLEKLEAERDAANAKSAALERASRIRSLAKDAGISAAKGVDPKSLDMLVALNAGVPGMCTIHANSARDAIVKMCTLPLLAGPNVSDRFVVPTVASSIDLVVHLDLDHRGQRRVREIVAVPGRVESGVVETAEIFRRDGVHLVRGEGYPPHEERFAQRGHQLQSLLRAS